MKKIELLQQTLHDLLGTKIAKKKVELNELTLEIRSSDLVEVMTILRDNELTAFEQCVDVCGIDYLEYKNSYEGLRFAAVYHLLSLKHNWRLRVKSFAQSNELPILPSVIDVWNSVNWFEREAFDLYGIIFDGHPDLRRILTDYGFIGHPFRKDFPLSGYVEMRYDEEQKRVVYQPITIEPREITPRIIREEGYSGRD